jgi:hypothetical protein
LTIIFASTKHRKIPKSFYPETNGALIVSLFLAENRIGQRSELAGVHNLTQRGLQSDSGKGIDRHDGSLAIRQLFRVI